MGVLSIRKIMAVCAESLVAVGRIPLQRNSAKKWTLDSVIISITILCEMRDKIPFPLAATRWKGQRKAGETQCP